MASKPNREVLWGAALALYAALIVWMVPIQSGIAGKDGALIAKLLRTGGGLFSGVGSGSEQVTVYHWGVLTIDKLAGGYNEFALRFPGAAAGVGIVLLVYSLVAFLSTPQIGVLSGALLLTCFGFPSLVHSGGANTVCAVFIVAAICTWVKWGVRMGVLGYPLRSIPPGVYWRVGTLCGVAALFGGWKGLGLPLGVIFSSACVVFRQGALSVIFRRGWLMAIVIPTSWFFVTQARKGFVFFFERLYQLQLSPLHLLRGVVFGGPWSLVLLLYLFFLMRAWRRKQVPNPFLPHHPMARFGVMFGIVWFVTTAVFLLFGEESGGAYLLTLLPAISVVLTFRLHPTWRRLREQGGLAPFFHARIFRGGLLAWCAVVAVTAGLVAMAGEVSWASGAALILAVASLWCWRRGFTRRNEILLGGAVLLLLQLIASVAVPAGYEGGFGQRSEKRLPRLGAIDSR